MSDATAQIGSLPAPAKEREESLPLPAPVPFSTPVLIGDCVTPLGGETVLSLIWKRIEGSREP